MGESLRNKTITGIFWSAAEKFSLQIVQFVINILMARFLLPSDYGMIGMVAVFLQLSQTLVDSGFANALIQKKDRTDVDFSTVFISNIAIAFLIYLIIFSLSPFIAQFYNIPALSDVLRIISISLILNGLSVVHKTRFTIKVDFKTQTKISFTAALVSGIVGVIMAYYHCGVWALVCNTLINSLILTFLYYLYSNWYPKLIFSKDSFFSLFSFGSKLMISSIIHTIYRNLYLIVIGKKFNAVELGYYTRAEQFAVFPSANLSNIISRVSYPVLSTIQDDEERLRVTYRKYISISSFFIFPLMIGLATLAKPVIVLLLTEKWIGIVVLLQILCLDWMFDHLSGINLNLLYVKGRSDLALRLEIIKKTIATIILFLSIPFGIEGMCWGRVLYSLIATYINTYYTNQLIGLSFIAQMKDIYPSLFNSLLMGVFIQIVLTFVPGNSFILQLGLGFFVGIIVYYLLSFFFCRNILHSLLQLIKRK